MPKCGFFVSATVMLLVSVSAQADVLSIATPTYTTPNSAAGVLRPTQGMTMQQVEQRFGAPSQRLNAIGEPPITRWHYPDFDVFFEHSQVIHAVVPRQQ
ncbi:hypothetical protein Q7C_1338 [Methylophaga frappieri]|uniref:Lipoprotein SmpA/OmlA domain-containing protein n=1 Tax=Methylophaga frappieri (strain ATCC BAA-2434 / DSM 25690 / JAM7) TaxID=754477 RepID=I1YHU5_METFJ|nr:hypothetical protein [Methylophaga frappieri]AFJ02488.1 hypothetical protein Q7C_1338 [Methylophaga frappieri]